MEYLIGLICIVVVIFSAVVVIHLRPLNEEEIRVLGQKIRCKGILQYFSFATGGFNVNKEFKKSMSPKGEFYQIDEDLFAFPSLAASLLKYKKHEWLIVAFEKNRKVISMWINKGPDRGEVSIPFTFEYLAELAKIGNQTSVLMFHNHPNYSWASNHDIKIANQLAQVFNHHGINFLDFVCRRGTPYRYDLSPADSFLPLSEFIDAIDRVNGVSRSNNLSLHYERIFGH